MRVLHVIRTTDPSTGGPASVVLGLAAAQQRVGDVVLIAIDDGDLESRVMEASPVPQVNLAVEQQDLKDVCRRFRPDVAVIHGVWCRLVRRALSTFARTHVPFVVAPHGALGSWSLRQKALKKWLALLFLYRRPLAAAAFFIVNSESERREVEGLRLGPRALLLPNGLDAALVWTERLPEPRGAPEVLFLGRLAEVKDPLLLLEAFALLAARHLDVRLVFVGPDGGLAAALEEARGALPERVRARVAIRGPAYGEEKWKILRGCSVLCLPSRYESFGMVLIEAISQGKPVVYTEECGLIEVARAGAGRIAAREPGAIAEALEFYLDPGAARQAGERGVSLVQERFIWSAVVTELSGHFRRLLAGES